MEEELTSISSIGGKQIKTEIYAKHNEEHGYLLKSTDLGQDILVIEDSHGHPSFEPEHFVLNNINGDDEIYHYGAVYSNDNDLYYKEWLVDTFDPNKRITIDDEIYYIIDSNNYPIGGGSNLTAGTDLVINNGVISVNTNGSAQGTYAFTEGYGTSAVGSNSHAEGNKTYSYGFAAHTEGESTTAECNYGHAEGWHTSATTVAVGINDAAHAEGHNTSAAGCGAHSEGRNTIASSNDGQSHAEGWMTSALAAHAHSEGDCTIASGANSHTEGSSTSAFGNNSHAGGEATIANDTNMTVIGKYNSTSSNAAFVIGNGISNSRKDAFIVDWNGNISATSGKITDLNTNGITIGTMGEYKFNGHGLVTYSISANNSITADSLNLTNYTMPVSYLNTVDNGCYWNTSEGITVGSTLYRTKYFMLQTTAGLYDEASMRAHWEGQSVNKRLTFEINPANTNSFDILTVKNFMSNTCFAYVNIKISGGTTYSFNYNGADMSGVDTSSLYAYNGSNAIIRAAWWDVRHPIRVIWDSYSKRFFINQKGV